MATTSSATGSMLDVAGIVSQLMTVEQRPLTALAKKEATYQSKLTAYGSVKGALSTFQTAMSGLAAASQFQQASATSSDSTILSATAGGAAVAGAYTINVSSLVQAQQVVAAGQTSQTAAIGTGAATTLTFDFGTITGNTLNATTGKYGTALSASTTTGSAIVTVASTANLAVGASITGAGIPAGATIASITNGTTLVLSANATATGAGVPLQANATFTSNGNGAKTVSIGPTNNSLQGIRDAINAANIGVTATIINDGSAAPFRLALTSNSGGVSNSMKITVAGDATLSGLLSQDPANNLGQNLSETVTAQNANFTVNGIAVTKTSNTVSDVINGVTLNLQKTTTTPATLTVARNNAAVSTAINNFVKGYNDLNNVLKNLSSYNAATKTGAILQGDSVVRTVQTQIRGMLNTPVTGAGAFTTLSQIGVSFQKDGSLALDSAKLNAAIASNPNDIAALFATVGTASDSLVSYKSATSTVLPGSYAVNVTQVATQGISNGNVNLNAGTTTIAAGTTMSVKLDGTTASVALAAGTYTAAQLAAQIQAAINGTTAFSSLSSAVTATIDASGFLNLTSTRYGSASNISLTSGAGTAVSTFMGAAPPAPVAGVDVTGTINGQAATGSGQTLTSSAGNSSGLQILINGGALGARGTVNYSQGYGTTLNTLATTILASGGGLDSATSGINKSITDIGKQRDALNARLATIQKNYTTQFSKLDAMLASMNTTSNYLTTQLANLPKA